MVLGGMNLVLGQIPNDEGYFGSHKEANTNLKNRFFCIATILCALSIIPAIIIFVKDPTRKAQILPENRGVHGEISDDESLEDDESFS